MNGMVRIGAIGTLTPAVADIAFLRTADVKRRIQNIPLINGMTSRDVRRMARLTQCALYASDRAKITDRIQTDTAGMYLGLTHGTTSFIKEFLDFLFEYGPEGASPNAFSNGMYNATLSAITHQMGLVNGGCTFTGYENCGLDVLNHAAYSILDGRLEACFAGAAEEYSPLVEEAYRRFKWFPVNPPLFLPSPMTDASPSTGFGISEGSVFISLEKTQQTPPGHGCFYSPVEVLSTIEGGYDLIISCAGGGPADTYELTALRTILDNTQTKPGLLFSKCFFGETFAVGPLLSAAIAWDILQNKSEYPVFPADPSLRAAINPQPDFSKVNSVLIVAAGRSGDVSAGIISRGPPAAA